MPHARPSPLSYVVASKDEQSFVMVTDKGELIWTVDLNTASVFWTEERAYEVLVMVLKNHPGSHVGATTLPPNMSLGRVHLARIKHARRQTQTQAPAGQHQPEQEACPQADAPRPAEPSPHPG